MNKPKNNQFKDAINKIKESKFGQFVIRFPEVVIGPLMLLWVFILIVIATNGLGLIDPAKQGNAISLGSLSIKWYAIFILTGIIFAAIYGYYEFPKLGISRNTLTDGLLVIVPLSIIGTRLYYVLFSGATYDSFLEVINLTDGGLAIHGGIITAIISVIVFAKIKKLNPLYFFDILVIGFLIGQVIGRWGNFLNQEAHGPAVSESSWVFYNLVPAFVRNNMNIGGTTYHPTFLYESFLNFIALVSLLVVRRFRLLKVGDSLGIYLIVYGLIRGLVIEPMRTDPLYIGSFKVNILFSLSIFAGGGVIYLLVKNIFFRNIPFYYDLAISENLYLKGLEGREYNKKQKEVLKAEKAERIKKEEMKYSASDDEIIEELNKMEEERHHQETDD